MRKALWNAIPTVAVHDASVPTPWSLCLSGGATRHSRSLCSSLFEEPTTNHSVQFCAVSQLADTIVVSCFVSCFFVQENQVCYSCPKPGIGCWSSKPRTRAFEMHGCVYSFSQCCKPHTVVKLQEFANVWALVVEFGGRGSCGRYTCGGTTGQQEVAARPDDDTSIS